MMSSIFKGMIDRVKTAAKVGVSVFLIQEYVAGFVICNGPSMEPTVNAADIILTDHVTPRLGIIHLGDVVIARSPMNYQCVCKRVVALPGDKVEFKGEILEIPADHFWLEGDNKINSSDSREYGPVPQYLIRRRCFCKIWPTFNASFGKEMHFCIAAVSDNDDNDSI